MRIFSSNILHYESCSLQILNYVSPKNAAKRTVLRLKGKCVWLVDHSRQEQICENARFIIDSTVSTEKDAREMMSSRVQKKSMGRTVVLILPRLLSAYYSKEE